MTNGDYFFNLVVWPYGIEYLVFWFLFIRPYCFGLLTLSQSSLLAKCTRS